ncbi:unnamed protein product, partial [Urochloa humidicola]
TPAPLHRASRSPFFFSPSPNRIRIWIHKIGYGKCRSGRRTVNPSRSSPSRRSCGSGSAVVRPGDAASRLDRGEVAVEALAARVAAESAAPPDQASASSRPFLQQRYFFPLAVADALGAVLRDLLHTVHNGSKIYQVTFGCPRA